MPSHPSADRSADQPPGRGGSVDALITQTRRLRGQMDAVRRETETQSDTADPRGRWERALCELASHQLRDLDVHLAQLRNGPPPLPTAPAGPAAATAERSAAPRGALLGAVGSAEWNLLTDEAGWSDEFYEILGRDPATPALTLDELPSVVLEEDRPLLTAMVTGCLVDARPIDGELRIVRPDGAVRTVHLMGEPVLDADGSTASMWAVLRDVSALRHSESAVRESREALRHHRHGAGAEQRLDRALRDGVPPAWRGCRPLARRGRPAFECAAHHLPAAPGSGIGGDWYDALELPDGDTLLAVGGLTGHRPALAADMAMLLGAVRGMAMAGAAPDRLLAWLNQLLDTTGRPALGSAVCCRYRPATRTLLWARAAHPAPLLFRDATGRALDAPDGVPLGAGPDAAYGQAEATLAVGDLLLLHTDALLPGHGGAPAADRLLGLAPRFATARTARDCVRTVVEECGTGECAQEGCVLVARVVS
ncbi:PP2C family protein-serine/threonine phosphatase [Streptomyces mexicanus]|uniref:PP2C family protein-serine/threonine phosphatase n=1 Tax=Streptomyces mexicanus TaxID=178566 RepID=UPI00135B909D|nr:SpoIIE family protein phosphatase [Streptomyces mexicanus]